MTFHLFDHIACTPDHHRQITASEESMRQKATNVRPWPRDPDDPEAVDLLIGECAYCRSTLAVEVRP